MKKRIIFSFIILVILITCTTIVFAGKYKYWFDIGDRPGEKNLAEATEKILGWLQWFGYAIAVGMLIYIGIKYTMSAASERASLKSHLISYVIGAIFIAAASTIAGFIIDIASEIDSNGGTQNEGTNQNQEIDINE